MTMEIGELLYAFGVCEKHITLKSFSKNKHNVFLGPQSSCLNDLKVYADFGETSHNLARFKSHVY